MQISRSSAAAMAETSNIVEQNQSISHSNSPPPRDSRILLPLPDPNSGVRRVSLMAHLGDLRDLVRVLVDSGPVPEVGADQPGDVPGPAVDEVRAGGGGEPACADRLLREYGGSSEGAADHNGEHGAVDFVGGLSGGEGELLRVGRRSVDAAVRHAGGDGGVCEEMGAVLQEVQRGAEGSGVLLLAEDGLLEGQGGGELREGEEGDEGKDSRLGLLH